MLAALTLTLSALTYGFVTEPGLFKAYICASETDVSSVADFKQK